MSAAAVAAALRERQSFILTSHARPDGDAIGSQLALAFALRALGKDVRLINRDPVPGAVPALSRRRRHRVRRARATGPADAVVTLECSDITTTGRGGPRAGTSSINIDHHLGNEMYGDVNWFDAVPRPCAEMVADVIDALGVPWTQEIATHLYLGIATDTGGFRHGPISASARSRSAGAIARDRRRHRGLAREIFDSFGIGRVKLTGAMLCQMELHHGSRLAVLEFDDALLARVRRDHRRHRGPGEPAARRERGARRGAVQAAGGRHRAASACAPSRRVDVRGVASNWGGGGHTNAAGCTLAGATRRAEVATSSRQLERRHRRGHTAARRQQLGRDRGRGSSHRQAVRARRRTTSSRACAVRERASAASGHTGTLDPRATGLLPLVLGKATRLASVLSGGDKTYDAIDPPRRLDHRHGRCGRNRHRRVQAAAAGRPGDRCRARARSAARSSRLPPNHSAKKIGGAEGLRPGEAGRAGRAKPVPVTVRSARSHTAEDGDRRSRCS